MAKKKMYVKSGQLEWVGSATGPLDAVEKALFKEGANKTLDSTYFFVDERGYRELDAQHLVPVLQGLIYSGYLLDEEDE